MVQRAYNDLIRPYSTSLVTKTKTKIEDLYMQLFLVFILWTYALTEWSVHNFNVCFCDLFDVEVTNAKIWAAIS